MTEVVSLPRPAAVRTSQRRARSVPRRCSRQSPRSRRPIAKWSSVATSPISSAPPHTSWSKSMGKSTRGASTLTRTGTRSSSAPATASSACPQRSSPATSQRPSPSCARRSFGDTDRASPHQTFNDERRGCSYTNTLRRLSIATRGGTSRPPSGSLSTGRVTFHLAAKRKRRLPFGRRRSLGKGSKLEGAYFLRAASRSFTCSLTFSRMFFGTPE